MDAYRAGFLHYDFSPGNIIITMDSKGLLINWDLSKKLGGQLETPRCAMQTVHAKFQLFVS
jgi:RIO-like serine/threonine protein kinase